jgi:hypothetical protein
MMEMDGCSLATKPGSGSQPVVAQVAVDVLHAVVPVEDQVALLDGPQSGHTQVDYVFEMPMRDEANR